MMARVGAILAPYIVLLVRNYGFVNTNTCRTSSPLPPLLIKTLSWIERTTSFLNTCPANLIIIQLLGIACRVGDY